MRRTPFVTLAPALALTLLASCSSMPSAEQQAGMAAEARKTAGGLLQSLSGELKAAMTANGPVGAIAVCKVKAPELAALASQKSGMRVKRVSPNNRAPLAMPDTWEAEAMAALEKRLASGEKPETLDTYAVVKTADGKGKTFRYAKALVTQQGCVACHGPADTLSEAVKAKLAAEYPGDKATGYTPGMIRGVLSIQKAL